MKNRLHQYTHRRAPQEKNASVKILDADAKRSYRSQKSSGFTIVELMIATTVFSIILLLCATGLIQVSRMYYKGITTSQTQEAARSVMDEISRSIQFGGGKVTGTSATGGDVKDYFCIGDKRYSFLIKKQLSDDSSPGPNQRPNVLIVREDASAPCDDARAGAMETAVSPTNDPDERELLRPNMRLAKLKVEETSADSNLYKVEIRVVYGDDDLLIEPPAVNAYEECGNFRAGTQFCAISELSTVVKRRVK